MRLRSQEPLERVADDAALEEARHHGRRFEQWLQEEDRHFGAPLMRPVLERIVSDVRKYLMSSAFTIPAGLDLADVLNETLLKVMSKLVKSGFETKDAPEHTFNSLVSYFKTAARNCLLDELDEHARQRSWDNESDDFLILDDAEKQHIRREQEDRREEALDRLRVLFQQFKVYVLRPDVTKDPLRRQVLRIMLRHDLCIDDQAIHGELRELVKDPPSREAIRQRRYRVLKHVREKFAFFFNREINLLKRLGKHDEARYVERATERLREQETARDFVRLFNSVVKPLPIPSPPPSP